MRNGGLERVEAIVERQQGMPPEGDHDRLLFNGQDGGSGLLGSCPKIGN
jgi:hypothetical protein